jgi:hypothetical protein
MNIIKNSHHKLSRLLLALTLAFSIQHSAFSQVTPTTIFVLTNLPAAVPGNSTSNLFGTNGLPVCNIINLRQGQGMATAMTYNGTNAATTLGFSLNWSVSIDGTNWQTTGFLQNSNAANGTNICTIWTNYASACLNNALYIAPYSLQNANAATNAITLSNVTVSFGNIVPGGYP